MQSGTLFVTFWPRKKKKKNTSRSKLNGFSSDVIKLLNRLNLHPLISGQVENTSRHTLRKVNRQMDIQLVKSFSTTDSVLKKGTAEV